jgi:hypothetical protein
LFEKLGGNEVLVNRSFSAPFWLLPFQGEGYWGRFSQGVALCYGLFAPLGRVGFAGAFWRSGCRLAPTLFTKKARRSVAYHTITNA